MFNKFNKFVENKKGSDEHYMRMAILAAERAKSKGDLAIGAVLAFPDAHLIEHNTMNSDNDIMAYAEINLLRKASQILTQDLSEAVLYTTLEPNRLCALAAYENGIKKIVFGAYDDESGFVSSETTLSEFHNFDKWEVSHVGGILSKECYDILPNSYKDKTHYE